MKTPPAAGEKVTFEKWDPADYITTKESVIAHLETAFEEKDRELLLSMLSDIIRSEGMNCVAGELGIPRESLYAYLGLTENPSFKTVLKLLDVLGFRLRIDPKSV
jgi:probable addiction module antidote protein